MLSPLGRGYALEPRASAYGRGASMKIVRPAADQGVHREGMAGVIGLRGVVTHSIDHRNGARVAAFGPILATAQFARHAHEADMPGRPANSRSVLQPKQHGKHLVVGMHAQTYGRLLPHRPRPQIEIEWIQAAVPRHALEKND